MSQIESHEPGAALVATSTAPNALTSSGVHVAGLGQPVGASSTDVLKGGMDRSGLFHALRRRWLLATSMSLLLGAATTVTLYMLFPETNSASVQYEASSSPLTLMSRTGASGQDGDYGIFKNTQLAYIQSPYVLTAALGANGAEISRLPMFDDIEEFAKVEWLRDQILASFPSKGEILEVTMSGPYPKEDLKKVVEAVSKAYYEEVVFRDQTDRALPLQILKGSLSNLKTEVRDKMELYQELARDSGTSAAYQGTFDPETKLMLSEVSQLLSKSTDLQSKLVALSTDFKIFETQIKDPAFLESRIDAAIAQDPMIGQLNSQITFLQMEISNLQSTVKNGRSPQIRQKEQQIAQLSQQIAQTREQMRAQLSGQSSSEPIPELKTATTTYQITRQSLQAQLAQMNQRIEELKQALLLKAENNTDLMLKLAEIEQLRSVEQEIATKIQNLQVEVLAPNRVRAIGSNATGAAIADTFENRNRMARLAISGLGGLGTMALTCFAIGFMEWRGRRLNGPEQIDEGLGIRVIGTLPSLSGKKALNPRHPVVAQLNESIDSVRTALMHESTTKKRQLVLVTSAETSEGRTTVASQLAASLARAGRRTLLVDGDLRRPNLHALFNSPLEDGLCEVLRAEAEVSDVIRPTQAEGLWLMTAGYCDADAVKALATDQVQPIFDKLRSDYDFVIIDGAPVLGLSDSLLFGQHCDGAILSVLRDRSGVPKIHASTELLRSVGVRMIGAVVNGVGAKADRRVTHLQQVTPKSEQKKLEAVEA